MRLLLRNPGGTFLQIQADKYAYILVLFYIYILALHFKFLLN